MCCLQGAAPEQIPWHKYIQAPFMNRYKFNYVGKGWADPAGIRSENPFAISPLVC